MWLYAVATAHDGIAMSVENAATCRDRVARWGSIVATAREFVTHWLDGVMRTVRDIAISPEYQTK